MDWDKAYSLNFTKQAVLYGMSFLTKINSIHSFDVEEAKVNFTSAMNSSNISNLVQFYTSIIKPLSISSPGNENVSLNMSQMFNETEIQYFTPTGEMFLCYTAPYSQIKHYMQQEKKTLANEYTLLTNSLSFEIKPNQFEPNKSEFVDAEHILYINEWFKNHLQLDSVETVLENSDFFQVYVPILLFPNGPYGRMLTLTPETVRYDITIQPTLHKLRPTKKNRCKTGVRMVVSKTASCLKICNRESYKYSNCAGSCLPLSAVIGLNAETNFEYICQNDFNFIKHSTPNDQSEIDIHVVNGTVANETYHKPNDQLKFDLNKQKYRRVDEINATELFLSCADRCGTDGCEKWRYDVIVFFGSSYMPFIPNMTTNYYIEIEYPLDGNVLAVAEADSQTWENFIGSVGGLLGIWTGASIVSIFQLFYLCCCSADEETTE